MNVEFGMDMKKVGAKWMKETGNLGRWIVILFTKQCLRTDVLKNSKVNATDMQVVLLQRTGATV